VTAALVFGASLGRLLGQPELRGWNWDVAVGEYATPDAAEEAPALLAANPDVSEFSGFGHGPMTVNGVDVELAAVSTDDGLVSSPVVTGRHPTGPGEVAFGLATLERLGKDLGDTVELTLAGGAPVTARVVGTVIPPAVLAPGMTLGSGGVLTYEGALQVVSEVVGDVPPDRYLVRLRSEADEQTAMARLSADFGDSVLGPTSTSDLENLRRVQSLRRRRRDLAVLKAIGFCRRQVRSVVGWKATSLAGIAVMVGLPIGLLAGTYAWTLVIERIGVSTATAVPLSALVTALAVVLLANLVAAGPAGRRHEPLQRRRCELSDAPRSRCSYSAGPASASSTDGGSKPSTVRNTISPPSASTMTVSPAVNSLNRMRSDMGSSIMRWMARRRGRAPSVGS
jgi:putative ABC transport system permease protein